MRTTSPLLPTCAARPFGSHPATLLSALLLWSCQLLHSGCTPWHVSTMLSRAPAVAANLARRAAALCDYARTRMERASTRALQQGRRRAHQGELAVGGEGAQAREQAQAVRVGRQRQREAQHRLQRPLQQRLQARQRPHLRPRPRPWGQPGSSFEHVLQAASAWQAQGESAAGRWGGRHA